MMDRFLRFSEGFCWLHGQGSGWQFGEQGYVKSLIDRHEKTTGGILFPRVAVEIGAGNGEKLPLALEPLINDGWHVIAYEANSDNQSKLRQKFRNNLAIRGSFKDGFELGYDQPQVVVIDVDGFDYPFMESVLQNCSPQLLMVEHYDLAGPCVTTSSKEDADVCPPRWMLGMSLFNEFRIQARTEALVNLANRFGYVLVMLTRVNSIFASASFAASVCEWQEAKEVSCG